MTNEEAKQVLRDWDGYFVGHGSDAVNEALEMAIKALEEEPQRAKGHWIMKHRSYGKMKYFTGTDEMGVEHTVKKYESYEFDEPYCSKCGKLAGDISLNYCSNCGADMRESDEE